MELPQSCTKEPIDMLPNCWLYAACLSLHSYWVILSDHISVNVSGVKPHNYLWWDNIDAKSSICGISMLIIYTFLFTNKAERTNAQLTLKVKVVKMKGPKSLPRVTTLKVKVTKLTWSRSIPWARTEEVTQSKCPVTLPNRVVPTRNPRRFMRLTSMWACLILKVRSLSLTLLCIYLSYAYYV